MKKHLYEGPFYWGDVYAVIGDNVIQLQLVRKEYEQYYVIVKSKKYCDEPGRVNYFSEKINMHDLSTLIEAAACETIEEFIDVLPKVLEVQDWEVIVKRFRSESNGKLISGVWLKGGKFQNELLGEIRISPKSGISQLFGDKLPLCCSITLMEGNIVGHVFPEN
ncbi:hypothetical protein LX69_00588 [Breznakibacter xylanolyticus]|uniref:Uncharacterized protein n=1 Tax=Breznakibacter xylanolyticus TaxID=990 RepID=A0A2W7NI71_9BACT|nr:hypothetical protein [Breznakibacter xylanolyticus]PZX20135.1 hypothetical protein LX69_00588 [Breznakibacter xylanolyticus]